MEGMLTNEQALPIFTYNFTRLYRSWGGTQGTLSSEIGVTQSRISYWLHGMSLPTFVNLYNLAKVFGCGLEEFYMEIPSGSVVEGEDESVQS